MSEHKRQVETEERRAADERAGAHREGIAGRTGILDTKVAKEALPERP